MPASDKLSRWIDLLAVLLRHRRPVTFEQLAREVPGYLADGSVRNGAPSDSLKRKFERDKDELRKMGVPIETIGGAGSDQSAYTLQSKDFYLPYLAVMTERGIEAPARVDRYGYRSLETLVFEPDELQAIADGAARVLQLGDSVLVDDTRSAMRKLAFDLPLGSTDGRTDDTIVPPASPADSRVLSQLGDALFARRRLTCAYHSMGADAPSTRTVEPYGLFFVSGHWYLVARDVDKNALRNFRVSRMSEVSFNTKPSVTPDYIIPADFSLREHAASRQAWEIGDLDSTDAVVEFRGQSGAAVAASALGKPDAAGPAFRRFEVRRIDSFARWLLSFAGEAVPITPATLVREYRQLMNDTRARYSAHG